MRMKPIEITQDSTLIGQFNSILAASYFMKIPESTIRAWIKKGDNNNKYNYYARYIDSIAANGKDTLIITRGNYIWIKSN